MVIHLWYEKFADLSQLAYDIGVDNPSPPLRRAVWSALMRLGLSSLRRTFVWIGRLAVPYEASTVDYRMFLKVTNTTHGTKRDAEVYCSTISVGTCVLQY